MPQHSGATGSELHVPLGYSPDSLVLLAATTDAYRIEDESNNQAFQINTNTDTITIGHNTADTWTLALYGAAVSVDLSDDQATAFVVEERADGTVEYIKVDTSNSAPLITLGNTVNDPVVLINTANVFRLGSATNAERALLTGAGGDLIYDSDDDVIYGYFGATWNDLTPGGGGGGTLDAAYDYGGSGAGRTITADAGAVVIAGTGGLNITGGSLNFDGSTIDLDPTGAVTLDMDAGFAVSLNLGAADTAMIVQNVGGTVAFFDLDVNTPTLTFGGAGDPDFVFSGNGEFRDYTGSAGGSGQVWTSNGSSQPASWEDASGGGGDLQDAYDSDPAIILTDGNPIALSHNNATTTVSSMLTMSWPAVAYTGTPHGLTLNMSTGSSLSNAGDVHGISLTGITNSGAGDSVGLVVTGFDIGAVVDYTMHIGDPSKTADEEASLTFNTGDGADPYTSVITLSDDIITWSIGGNNFVRMNDFDDVSWIELLGGTAERTVHIGPMTGGATNLDPEIILHGGDGTDASTGVWQLQSHQGTGAESVNLNATWPTNGCAFVMCMANAYDETDNLSCTYIETARVDFNSGTATLQDNDSLHGDEGDPAWSFGFGVSGNNVQFSITSDATNTTRWAFLWWATIISG